MTNAVARDITWPSKDSFRSQHVILSGPTLCLLALLLDIQDFSEFTSCFDLHQKAETRCRVNAYRPSQRFLSLSYVIPVPLSPALDKQ